jgi:hypothetical protein
MFLSLSPPTLANKVKKRQVIRSQRQLQKWLAGLRRQRIIVGALEYESWLSSLISIAYQRRLCYLDQLAVNALNTIQRTTTEEEGSICVPPHYGSLFSNKVNSVCNIRRSRSELVSTWRSIVMCLPL